MNRRPLVALLPGLLLAGGLAAAVPATAATHPGAARSCIRSFAPPPDTGDAPFGVTAGPGGTWYGDGTTINKISHGRTTTYTVPHVNDRRNPGVGWLTWNGGNRVWFGVRSDGRLGYITGQGHIHTVHVPKGKIGTTVIQGIVVHPGRSVWFSDQENNRIGRYSLKTGKFTFWTVPTEQPQALLETHDGDYWFIERADDKVGRLDPRTGLFTEWTLPTGSFPNRLALTPDGSVWFTALFGNFFGRITHGVLHTYHVGGGPVGLTYARGALWTARFTHGGLSEVSRTGKVVRKWGIHDELLQVAYSHGALWLTGAKVWRVDPTCH